MTNHTDIDRERRYWSRSPMTREQVRTFDPDGALGEEVMFAAQDAMGWDDWEVAGRLADVALSRAPDDPRAEGLAVWVRAHPPNVPSKQHVDSLASFLARAPGSPLAVSRLIRALTARGDVAGAVRTFEDVPAEQRDEPWIRVAEAVMRVAQGDARAGLDILRALRASWPARGFSLLTYEMVLAASLRDAASFRDAYEERCRVEGHRPWPLVPAAWLRVRVFIPASAIVWALGVVLDLPWLWLSVVAVQVGYLILHWHVLRSRRLTSRGALILVGALAISLIWGAAVG